MKRYTTVLLTVAVMGLSLAIAGCSGDSSSSSTNAQSQVQQSEQTSINDTLLTLQRAEPPAKPTDSANLHVQNAWYTAEADPNKIWYGELISSSGTLVEPYVTQGPAVDASDQVTNPLQAVWNTDDQGCNCSGSIAGVGIGLAEPDGTYDATSPELVAILADGAIVRIWVGNDTYIQSDQPFRTTQTPLITMNETVAPSHTATAGTSNALVPSSVK